MALDQALIERRFTGRLDHAEALPDDPSHAVAELVCDPPERAIRELADGESVEARLLWRPPVFSLPLPTTGVVLVALGLIGTVLGTGLRLRGGVRRSERSGEPGAGAAPGGAEPVVSSDESAPSAGAAVATESAVGSGNGTGAGLVEQPAGTSGAELGANGAILRMLGGQLRSGILAQQVDPSTLAAVEWALDRHHARAVRTIGRELSGDPELRVEAARLVQRLEERSEREEEAELAHLADRLARICRVFDLERDRIDREPSPARSTRPSHSGSAERRPPHHAYPSRDERDEEDRLGSPAGA
jgi:hypothetical protein